MFDMRFISLVKKVMAWGLEAPGAKFLNPHEYHLQRKQGVKNYLHTCLTVRVQEIGEDECRLRNYIMQTYLPYFGLEFNTGKKELVHNAIWQA